jgi:hypothetical protein
MYESERQQGYRYLILDKDGNILFRYLPGTRFQWDFTLPGPAKGGRAVDLKVERG